MNSESNADDETLRPNPSQENAPDGETVGEDGIHHELIDLEAEFGGLSRWVWIGSFFGPWLIGASILGGYYLYEGVFGLRNLAIAIAGTFLVLGRFVILFGGDDPIQLPNGIEFQMTSEALFVMLTIMDTLVAFFVAFHMDFLYKIPILGPKLEEMVSDGRFILKHQPWIRNVAFVGLVIFVIFPSSTTGSIGGSIFGRLLGMKRKRVVTAILIGSLIGNGLMLILASWISQYITNDNIWLKLGSVLGMIVILVVVERYYRRLKKKYLAKEAEEKEAEEKLKAEAESNAEANSDDGQPNDRVTNGRESDDSRDTGDSSPQTD